MRYKVLNGTILIDESAMDFFKHWSWSINNKGYVVCGMSINGKKFTARLHRLIMGAQEGEIVDHVNGNRLDNRWQNLRIASAKENCRNRYVPVGMSRTKGVTVCSERNKWRAIIHVNGKNKFLGRFNTVQEAAKVYRKAELKYFKEYARSMK